jgi:hypothetical protein
MLVLTSLASSMLALAAARCSALGRETRRAQGLALAESAVAAFCAEVDAGRAPSQLEGSLPTGRYLATAERADEGHLVLTASGHPLALRGRPVDVKIEATLVRQDGHWRIVAWQEVQP